MKGKKEVGKSEFFLNNKFVLKSSNSFGKILYYADKIGYFNLAVLVILVLSIIMRFYNFPLRWGLGSDDARDALIGLEALRMHSIPLMGSFSSAGPFVIGAAMYWLIMASYLVLPLVVNAPWIITAIISVVSVLLFVILGNILAGRKFALISGLLAAFSPQLVVRATVLSNTTFVYTACLIVIIFFLLLYKRKKGIYAFWAGIFLGLAVSFHYQSLNLLIFLPVVFVIPGMKLKDKIISFCVMFLGFLIPLLPLLYWDSGQKFANIRNIMDYFLIAQYRIYFPNSWKLFIFDYLPTYWSYLTGMYIWVAIILFFLSSIIFFFASVRKKISSSFILLGVIYFILIFVNRFYHGERSEGYFLYLAPFILIMTSLIFYILIESGPKLIKALGVVLLLIIIIFNSQGLISTLGYKNQVVNLVRISDVLSKKFPDKKFAIYDYKFMAAASSIPLSLIMNFQNRSDSGGLPIGVLCNGCIPGYRYKNLLNSNLTVKIVGLWQIKQTPLDQKKGIWIRVNEQDIYEAQVGWLNKDQLRSNFSLKKYIIGGVGKII